MSMIEHILVETNEIYQEMWDKHYIYDLNGAKAKVLRDAMETIKDLSAKVARMNMERSCAHYHDGWIPVDERTPEESLESVIGWDAIRDRECFVQYLNGRFVLGDDTHTVEITHWMPKPGRPRMEE